MTREEALKFAINILNSIPNTNTSYGKTYELIPQLVDALIDNEPSNLSAETPFGFNWTLEDIIDYGAGIGKTITIEQAYEIAQEIDNKFDAERGINWDTIAHVANKYIKDHIND